MLDDGRHVKLSPWSEIPGSAFCVIKKFLYDVFGK